MANNMGFMQEMRDNIVKKKNDAKGSIIVGLVFIIGITFMNMIMSKGISYSSGEDYKKAVVTQILSDSVSTSNDWHEYDFIVKFKENGTNKTFEVHDYKTTVYLHVDDIVFLNYKELADGKVSYSIKRSSANLESVEDVDDAAGNTMNLIVGFFYIFGGIFLLGGIKQYKTYSEYEKIQRNTDEILARKRMES